MFRQTIVLVATYNRLLQMGNICGKVFVDTLIKRPRLGIGGEWFAAPERKGGGKYETGPPGGWR